MQHRTDSWHIIEDDLGGGRTIRDKMVLLEAENVVLKLGRRCTVKFIVSAFSLHSTNSCMFHLRPVGVSGDRIV